MACFPLYRADAFAPGKSKIVFVSTRGEGGREGIYTMDEDGQNVYCLTFDKPDNRWPSWSPDGGNIIFVNEVSGIHIMDSDGSNLQILPVFGGCPKWSPDGKKIAFSAGQFRTDIYVMNIYGKNIRKLTKEGLFNSSPAWSPDGKKIAFASSEDLDGKVKRDIYVMDIDGENLQKLTNWKIGIGANSPAWSPNGRKIAFDAVSGDNNADIYIMNSDGTGIQRITEHPLSDVQPKWLDNQRIIFVSFRDGNSEIYVMDIDGSNLRNLTNNPAEDSEPDCWPGYFSVWSVSSKGKLSSAWGQFKQ